jgi:hypothetical protein
MRDIRNGRGCDVAEKTLTFTSIALLRFCAR